MALTYLEAVNETLKRTGDIAGDAGDLTSFTDSARQTTIDVVLQVWNEAIHELYSFGVLQGEVTEGSITLVTDQTSYAVPTSPVFEQMSGKNYRSRVMTNSVNNHRMFEYQGGFDKLFADQPNRANFTGQPQHWTMNPINNKFEIDRTPTSGENGDIYKFLYDGRINLTSTSQTFPFSDTVVDSLVPVVAEIVKLSRNKASRDPISGNAGFNRAMRMITQKSTRKSYGTWRARRIGYRGPFED